MRVTIAMAILGVFVVPATAQQTRPLQSCPLLSTADAAALAGPGVEFYSARETNPSGGQTTLFCAFGVGEGRTLTITTGPSLARTAADYQKMYEPLRKMANQQVEPGIGEYAYSQLEGGTAELTAVKGTLTLRFELKGDDLKPADLDKLRAAVRKALPKI